MSTSKIAVIGKRHRSNIRRNRSIDQTSFGSKLDLMKVLKDTKKINIADLLKKKLRKDVGVLSFEMEKYINVIIEREVNLFLNAKDTPFSVEGLKEVKRRIIKIKNRCQKKLSQK